MGILAFNRGGEEVVWVVGLCVWGVGRGGYINCVEQRIIKFSLRRMPFISYSYSNEDESNEDEYIDHDEIDDSNGITSDPRYGWRFSLNCRCKWHPARRRSGGQIRRRRSVRSLPRPYK